MDVAKDTQALDAAYQRRIDVIDERLAWEDRLCVALYAMTVEQVERLLPQAFGERLNALMGEVLEAVIGTLDAPEDKRDGALRHLTSALHAHPVPEA